MKIVLTGHTSGLGKGLYEQLGALGHEVYGYSTSTGFDINDEVHRHKIIGECKDADLFINNAYGWIEPNIPSVRAFAKQSVQQRSETPTELGQVKLFEMFSNLWKGDSTKHIINMSSDITHANIQGSPELKTYWFAKRLLNEKGNVSNVTNLKLGTFESKFSQQLPEGIPKADVKHYVDYVLEIIKNINSFYISDMLLTIPSEGEFALECKKDPKKLEKMLDFTPKDNVQYANMCNIEIENIGDNCIDNMLQFILDKRYDLWPKWITLKGIDND